MPIRTGYWFLYFFCTFGQARQRIPSDSLLWRMKPAHERDIRCWRSPALSTRAGCSLKSDWMDRPRKFSPWIANPCPWTPRTMSLFFVAATGFRSHRARPEGASRVTNHKPQITAFLPDTACRVDFEPTNSKQRLDVHATRHRSGGTRSTAHRFAPKEVSHHAK